MKKIVIGLSGGLDSTTLLSTLLEQGFSTHCCSFIYGSKHNPYEIEAAKKVVNYYRNKGYVLHHSIIDISPVFASISSVLLSKDSENIPEGHYDDISMSKTIVPSRNLIFASIMNGIAESVGAQTISLGVHAGDHFIYPDCRPEFLKALDTTIYLASDKKVQIHTPLTFSDKTAILEQAIRTKAPIELTRTCYKPQEYACGKCGSCTERLEAFANLNLKDPIKYMD